MGTYQSLFKATWFSNFNKLVSEKMKTATLLMFLVIFLLGCSLKVKSLNDLSSGEYFKNSSLDSFKGQWASVHDDKPYNFSTIAKKKNFKNGNFNFETDIIQLILINKAGSDIKINKYFKDTLDLHQSRSWKFSKLIKEPMVVNDTVAYMDLEIILEKIDVNNLKLNIKNVFTQEQIFQESLILKRQKK